jgi:NAD kinase
LKISLISRYLIQANVTVYIETPALPDFEPFKDEKFLLDKLKTYNCKLEDAMDLSIIVGGDGTILWALQYFSHRIPPPIMAFSNVILLLPY